jgi:hypothetical protein
MASLARIIVKDFPNPIGARPFLVRSREGEPSGAGNSTKLEILNGC